MAFCSHCGKQVQDGVAFCPSCGGKVGAAPQQQQQFQQQPAYQQPLDDAADIQQNKTMAILAYILFFIPLISGAHKTSRFAKYHTNQGTVLWLFAVAYGILHIILMAIFRAIFIGSIARDPWGWALNYARGTSTLYTIFAIVFGLLWIIPTVFAIIGIINANSGKYKPLPVIGKINLIK